MTHIEASGWILLMEKKLYISHYNQKDSCKWIYDKTIEKHFNKATVISIQYVFSGTLKKAMEVTVEMRSCHIFAHLRKKSQGTLARSCSFYNLN